MGLLLQDSSKNIRPSKVRFSFHSDCSIEIGNHLDPNRLFPIVAPSRVSFKAVLFTFSHSISTPVDHSFFVVDNDNIRRQISNSHLIRPSD